MKIRKALPEDIPQIADIYRVCFPGEKNHLLWIESSFRSQPKGIYYVVENGGEICGYILWCVKNGFRNALIAELEQIAILPDFSGRGLGRQLIERSFKKFTEHVTNTGCSVGAIIVTTADGNPAENLYVSTLGVQRPGVIEEYGRGNEVILYRRIATDSDGRNPDTTG